MGLQLAPAYYQSFPCVMKQLFRREAEKKCISQIRTKQKTTTKTLDGQAEFYRQKEAV